MSATRVFAVPGNSFGADVVDVTPKPAPEVARRELMDEFLTVLSALFADHLEEGSEDARLCERLIGRRIQINKACAEFIQRQAAPMRQRLIDAHEEVKRQALEQEAKIAELRATIDELNGELNKKRDGQGRALAALHAAQQSRKSLSRFTSRAEILAADQYIEKCSVQMDKADAAESDVQQRLNQIRMQGFEPLMREMDKIIAEEMRLRGLITGEGYTTDLGIVVPPSAPIL